MRPHIAPAFSTGRRVRSDLYPNQTGTLVKVRLPNYFGEQPSYDVAWDDGTGVEKVAQSLLQGPSWRTLPETLSASQTEAHHRAYLEEKLRVRTEQAKARLALGGSAPDVAFYRPSEAYVRELVRSAHAQPDESKQAAQAMREAFAAEFDGVRFIVRTKGDQVSVVWTDGPVFISKVTDKYTHGRAHQADELMLPHAGRVVTRREISDALIESATEYVRQVINEPIARVSAEMFRDGSLRDVYPRSDSGYSGLSVGRLIRVVLLRWDDHALRFTSEGLTRAMVVENEVLFPGRDMQSANSRMRLIRESASELQFEGGSAFDEVKNQYQREA